MDTSLSQADTIHVLKLIATAMQESLIVQHRLWRSVSMAKMVDILLDEISQGATSYAAVSLLFVSDWMISGLGVRQSHRSSGSRLAPQFGHVL